MKAIVIKYMTFIVCGIILVSVTFYLGQLSGYEKFHYGESRANATLDLVLLELLRKNELSDALDLLESRLDSHLIEIASFGRNVQDFSDETQALLLRIKDYRERHSRSPIDRRVSEKIDQLFDDLERLSTVTDD